MTIAEIPIGSIGGDSPSIEGRYTPYTQEELAATKCCHCLTEGAATQVVFCVPPTGEERKAYLPICAPCLLDLTTLLGWFFRTPYEVVE